MMRGGAVRPSVGPRAAPGFVDLKAWCNHSIDRSTQRLARTGAAGNADRRDDLRIGEGEPVGIDNFANISRARATLSLAGVRH